VLANVAVDCEYNYSAMGKAGFLYDSMKDSLKWRKLSVKYYIKLVSQIGQILSMSEEDYKKEKAKVMKINAELTAQAFKSAFGDGK